MSGAKNKVRQSVLGADRAFKVIDGGGKGGKTKPPADRDDDPCPVVGLGDDDGRYHFLDTAGQKRTLTARDLGSRHTLVGLLRGDDSWLRRKFPKKKDFPDGDGGTTTKTVDFYTNEAARFFIELACRPGIMGASTTIRRTGIWRSDDGMPIVHSGDSVLIDGEPHPPGLRTGNQIWAAAEAAPRPGTPCDHSVAVALQQDLQRYWLYRVAAAPIAIIGLLYSGWLCGASDWRLNAFITGGSGSGKSQLRSVLRAALPMHDYSNDTSKAGMEQTIAGRAVPAIIDEVNDRNRSAGRDLVDIVLSASGDEGTKLARGTSDGKGRSAEVVSNVVMFSIDPPELEPQHMNRFVLIELLPPLDGAGFQAEHAAIIEAARKNGPALWGRAIASWERYLECLLPFRLALRDRGCSPREQDGKSRLLAGWFVMTHEGLPTEFDIREGVAAIDEYIVTAKQAAMDDGPRRALGHLLNFDVALHRSTDRDPIGMLLDIAFNRPADDYLGRTPAAAAEVLNRNGIRVVRCCSEPAAARGAHQCRCPSCWDNQRNKPVPRASRNDGVWIANRHPALDRVFANTSFDGGRWRHQLMRLPSAVASGRSVRVGGNYSGHAFWLEASDLQMEDDPP